MTTNPMNANTSPLNIADMAAAMTGGGASGGNNQMAQVLQMMQAMKGGGGDQSAALKAMLQQRLQGALGNMAPNDPARQWVMDALAGKEVDKRAILAANPGLLENLKAKNPAMYQMLLQQDPTFQAFAAGGVPAQAPQASYQASYQAPAQPQPAYQPPPMAPAPQVNTGMQEKFWGHLKAVSEMADRAYQAAQGSTAAVQQQSLEVRDLRTVVNQLVTAQQEVNNTIRNLPKAIADMVANPPKAEG